MPDSDLEKKLVRDLHALFPQEATSTDRWFLDRGNDPTENNVALTSSKHSPKLRMMQCDAKILTP
jgi:hypothetical protein